MNSERHEYEWTDLDGVTVELAVEGHDLDRVVDVSETLGWVLGLTVEALERREDDEVDT